QASAGVGDRRLPAATGRRKPGRLSLEWVSLKNPAQRNAARRGCRGRNPPTLKSASLKPANLDFASLLNIAHLHFRFARQASERDSQLGATITSHAAQA